jgi:hypothetical protein
MDVVKLLTAGELAKLIGVGQEKQIMRWTRDSENFPYQLPGQRRYRMTEVLDWMKRGSAK